MKMNYPVYTSLKIKKSANKAALKFAFLLETDTYIKKNS